VALCLRGKSFSQRSREKNLIVICKELKHFYPQDAAHECLSLTGLNLMTLRREIIE